MQKETGVVKWFNDRKGYGFIAREGKDDIFVHYSDITGDGFRTLNEGDSVEFTLKEGQKGLAAGDVSKTPVRSMRPTGPECRRGAQRSGPVENTI